MYIRIKESDLHNKGHHIKDNIWYYEGKDYKIMGFEIATNEFICNEIKEAK